MSQGNRQRWEAMSVREYTTQDNQRKSFWTKIGAGFTNQDGSITIKLDCLPIDGHIVLQIPLSKEEKQARFANRGGGGGQRGGFGGGGQRGGGQQQRYRGGQPQSAQQTFHQGPADYEPDQQGGDDEPFPE